MNLIFLIFYYELKNKHYNAREGGVSGGEGQREVTRQCWRQVDTSICVTQCERGQTELAGRDQTVSGDKGRFQRHRRLTSGDRWQLMASGGTDGVDGGGVSGETRQSRV